jgi:hypothetical protein
MSFFSLKNNVKNYNDIFFFIHRKPKTKRGKRFLEGRESKVVENVKKAMFIKGGRTNEAVSKALKEMVFYVYF